MGEARRRGTYQQRVSQAQEKALEQQIRAKMLLKDLPQAGRRTGKTLLLASLLASVSG